ncbi:unnamed protein product [Caenorhabditis auriculariae]|uniref:CX domain-containing protein n=1 Tax=Caenorhabditis auriculariae TaxID=2777116 RepID=A0A8S1GRW7_9PELO|nr:unnamed protein product [Caenorhabditis auriculariae]
MGEAASTYLLLTLLLASVVPQLDARRGGVSMGGGSRVGGRGMSGARTSSGGSGGWFGSSGGRKSGSSAPAGGNAYGRNTNFGRGATGNIGSSRSSHGTGIFGGRKQGHSGGIFGGGGRSNYGSHSRKSGGIGGVLRSNQFKNAIVGAAAGYLTYQAGKAIIRAAAAPMMWNSRPYYWGSNYYRGGAGRSNMCRMPVDPNDGQFGNVYFQDNTRPREIVWGCEYYEYCCGYECCRGGGAGSSTFGGSHVSMGMLLALVCLACCCIPICFAVFRRGGLKLPDNGKNYRAPQASAPVAGNY